MRLYRRYPYRRTYTRLNQVSRYPHGHLGKGPGHRFQTVQRQRLGRGHTTVRIPRHLIIYFPNSGGVPIHNKNRQNHLTHPPTPTQVIHHIQCTGIPHRQTFFPGSIPLGAQTCLTSVIPNHAPPWGYHPQRAVFTNSNGHSRPPPTLHFEHIPAQLTGSV